MKSKDKKLKPPKNKGAFKKSGKTPSPPKPKKMKQVKLFK